jgi:hypothetical protein
VTDIDTTTETMKREARTLGKNARKQNILQPGIILIMSF